MLARSLRWAPERIVDQLDDLLAIVGEPVRLDAPARADAAALTSLHRLTYDASWAAVARRHRAALISSDRELLAADLAVSASAFVADFGRPTTPPA